MQLQIFALKQKYILQNSIFVETKFVNKTLEQYDHATNQCKSIFSKKNKDYGSAWRILRPSSVTDQIFIKANRIRTIEESGENQVGESVDNEYIGIVNYCVMALIQLEKDDYEPEDIAHDELIGSYDQKIKEAKDLMETKNADYGEVWRDMRRSSITDLILMKILRLKQIEDNEGELLISEGPEANYLDIINYAIFALIKIEEKKQ